MVVVWPSRVNLAFLWLTWSWLSDASSAQSCGRDPAVDGERDAVDEGGGGGGEPGNGVGDVLGVDGPAGGGSCGDLVEKVTDDRLAGGPAAVAPGNYFRSRRSP